MAGQKMIDSGSILIMVKLIIESDMVAFQNI